MSRIVSEVDLFSAKAEDQRAQRRKVPSAAGCQYCAPRMRGARGGHSFQLVERW